MHRFRSILLSGLVALLMVGMVNAGEVSSVSPGPTVDAGFNFYFGVLSPDKTDCLPATASDCLHIGFNISFEWLRGFLS